MRRALCVGIDEYEFGALSGCVHDAERIANILGRHQDGQRNFDVRLLVAPERGRRDAVTRVRLRKNIEELFKDPAEIALLHFSGHGTFNNLDGFLVTQDAETYDEGVAMSEILKAANDSKSDEVLIFLDCCFSGKLGNPPLSNNSSAVLREGVSILTASRDDQPSVEIGGGGLFTSLVGDALEGGASDLLGCVTAPAIYSYVEAALGAWDQRPLFKSHVDRLRPIRRCKPPILLETLRRIPLLFPLPAEDFALDPTFERTFADADPTKVAIFQELQTLSRVHLVVPNDVPHMYDAAMQSKSCRLTPTGLYYWRLAKNGRI